MARRRNEPIWVDRLVLDAVHLDLIRTHGGLPGLRDENILESALARPRQRWAYAKRRDLVALAAAYGFGLARNHPYRDGNRRVAILAMAVFLGLNGYEIEAPEDEVVAVILGVADGSVSESVLARWVRGHILPVPER